MLVCEFALLAAEEAEKQPVVVVVGRAEQVQEGLA